MAPGNNAPTDQINIDRSDDEIVKFYFNFEWNFDALSSVKTLNAQMTSKIEIDDEVLAYCLSQIEEKEDIGKESNPRFSELKKRFC